VVGGGGAAGRRRTVLDEHPTVEVGRVLRRLSVRSYAIIDLTIFLVEQTHGWHVVVLVAVAPGRRLRVFLKLVKTVRGQRLGVPEPTVLVGCLLVMVMVMMVVVVRVRRSAGTVTIVSRLVGRTHVAEHAPVFPVAVHLPEQLLGDHYFVRRPCRAVPLSTSRLGRRVAADGVAAAPCTTAVLFGEH